MSNNELRIWSTYGDGRERIGPKQGYGEARDAGSKSRDYQPVGAPGSARTASPATSMPAIARSGWMASAAAVSDYPGERDRAARPRETDDSQRKEDQGSAE